MGRGAWLLFVEPWQGHEHCDHATHARVISAAGRVARRKIGERGGSDAVVVRSSDFGAFTHVVAPAAQRSGVTILELMPTDESLESVFSYLVRR